VAWTGWTVKVQDFAVAGGLHLFEALGRAAQVPGLTRGAPERIAEFVALIGRTRARFEAGEVLEAATGPLYPVVVEMKYRGQDTRLVGYVMSYYEFTQTGFRRMTDEEWVRQVNAGLAAVENEFSRAVSREGNLKAQRRMAEVFELRSEFEWRGLGLVPRSALKIGAAYAAFDAERRFGLEYRSVPDHKACECGAILRGVKRPQDCRIFGSVCTPANPVGSCMVSSEGACAAHYSYGRYRDAA
jgi:hypothetical protein